MNIVDLSVKELYEKLKSKEITSYEIYQAYMNNIKAKDKEIGAFLSLNENINKEEYNLKYNIPIGIKDNIAVKGLPFTGSSKMLESYIAPYDASVIKSLKDSGAYIIGKTNLDEFGSGGSTQNSTLLKTSNPKDISRIPGGSSGGSAAAVAAQFVPWAIGSDTGGSIRQPASYCGVVGFKPSYGLVPRYGAISFMTSFDHVGTITKTVEDTALLLNIISTKTEEEKDPNTVILNKDYTKNLNDNIKGKRIAVIKEIIDASQKSVQEKMKKAIKTFEDLGAIVEEISLPYLDVTTAIYVTLGYAEASSNFSIFDGVRYGTRINEDSYEKMIIKTRTNGLTFDVKKRIIIGSNTLQEQNYNKYYLKAAKARRKIVEDINKKFKTYDVLISPTEPDVAPKKDNIVNIVNNVILANVAGIPAISVPIDKEEGLPVGLQIMGPLFKDEVVLNVANMYEKNI